MKVYRGAARGARAYLNADHSRADDYYLTEGSGIARRYVAGAAHPVHQLAPLTGDGYEAWVAGLDPETGEPRGRLRQDANAVRFVEVVVNGPKSWSLAAELHADVAAAHEGAQTRAAGEILGWLAQHVTTRVGPRGGQIAVPVERLEAAVVRHYTSRAGDPHRHLHLQVNARVFAAGKWRGLDTVAVREALAAVNGIGHASIACDPPFRAALARHGYTLNADGEIAQLASYVGAFSRRAAQITRHLDRYERAWRAEHPNEQPGPMLRRAWDARAWADERPDKAPSLPSVDLNDRWLEELARLGHCDRDRPIEVTGLPVAGVDRDRVVDVVLAELGAARSAWNAADVRGAVEQRLATLGLLADRAARSELAEDLTARALTRCVPLLHRSIPAHIRALTSQHVIDVEADLVGRLAARAAEPGHDLDPTAVTVCSAKLDMGQAVAVAALAGDRALVVIEGAAGAGKTTTLAAARDQLSRQGQRMIVVTPTLRAAQVVESEVGAPASSAARLVYAYGWRWDQHGIWTRLRPGESDPAVGSTYIGPPGNAQLRGGDLVLVDEAGMLDQDTAAAVLTLADEVGARVALVGDRHQLPAVGRGGALDHAARWSEPVALDVIHRFVTTTDGPSGRRITIPDTEYAQLSQAMRGGENPDAVYTSLHRRGQIALHTDTGAMHMAVAEAVVADRQAGRRSFVIAATREQVAEANAVIHEAMVAAGHVDNTHTVATRAGERIGAGDIVATRRNDRNLDVANRETWTVTAVTDEGGLRVSGPAGERMLPAAYLATEVELAYAITAHGAQGHTVDHAHLILDEHTTAAAAYVGLTRGRHSNTAHILTADETDAREQWSMVFARGRADLGPAVARDTAAREAARYAPTRPLDAVLADLRQAWLARADARERLARLRPALEHAQVAAAGLARLEAASGAAHSQLATAQSVYDIARLRLTATDHAIVEDTEHTARQLRAAWDAERPAAQVVAQRIEAGVGRFGRGRREVESAREQLDAWAGRWQPLFAHLPDSLADPAALAAGWHDQAIVEAIHARAAGVAKTAHPGRPEQRRPATAAESAHRAALDRAVALTAERDLAQRHGNPERIATLRDLVADADQRLIAVDRDLRVLVAEPAIANQPNATALLATAAHTWQHERRVHRDAERAVEGGIESLASHNLRYGIDHQRDHGPRLGR